MAGIVYLRTNKFEVKLEGITFKARDFDSLCKFDFLFPKGRVWICPPVVGVDVMRHPRDPSILLLLLCFGVGCVILRFNSGESIPQTILKFLTDERIRFVGFGIPEKIDLFPFEELGLTKTKIDVGYLAAEILNDSKFKSCELAELSRKVLGIKKMVGLTEASSFERHERIKASICQLFVASVTAMALLQPDGKKKLTDSPKKRSFFKSLNLLPLLNEGWFKVSKEKKHNSKFSHFVESCYNLRVRAKYKDDVLSEDSFYPNPWEGGVPTRPKCKKGGLLDDFFRAKSYKEGGFDDVWAHVRGIDPIMSDDDVCHNKIKKCGINDSFQAKVKVRGSVDDFVCVKCKECGSGDFGFVDDYIHAIHKGLGYDSDLAKAKEKDLNDDFTTSKYKEGGLNDEYVHSYSKEDSSGDDFVKIEASPPKKVPLKGILKCPSTGLESCSFSPPSTEQKPSPNLRRANSKGYNVTFKEH